MSRARNISVSWDLYPDEISFIVEFYDKTIRKFHFCQQSEGYRNHILYDADAHYGWDEPLMHMTVTYKTSYISVISKCLTVLYKKYGRYND
jgi:hypothetical protein